MKLSKRCLAVGLLALGFVQMGQAAANPFYLHNGDRVLFYGDSITEQRYYPVAVETYVRTRFPNLQVRFVDSAVGGARVVGNWAGPVDVSLQRDVFPFKPDIVTIMLGMNDGQYQPFSQTIFDTYKNGYKHIIQSLQAHLPGIKIVLIEPTPWDDVTLKPGYPNNPQQLPGGYNGVLLRYCQFVRKLGAEHHFMVVDFNTPLVTLMEEAEKIDPALAGKIIPGRVHPGASAELAMAQALLEAWSAPAVVTRVEIDASGARVVESANTTVSELSARGRGVSWSQNDKSLPYPIMTLHSTQWPQFPPSPFSGGTDQIFWKTPPVDSQTVNPVAALVVRLTNMYERLDSETLKVTGLTAPSYTLKIDGRATGTFSRQKLAQGINLAEYDTPMMAQAGRVLTLVWHRVDVRFFGWRAVQLPLRQDKTPGIQTAVNRLLAKLNQEQNSIIAQMHIAAQPKMRHYELEPL